MKKSTMSVKAMIDLYVTYQAEEGTWDMLYKMACHGLISWENWSEFFETCKGWELRDDGIHDDESLIYKYDEEGYLRRVA